MLESLSPRLLAPGAAHHACPDKEAAPRLQTLVAAGLCAVPFTTGLLVGIGETRQERLEVRVCCFLCVYTCCVQLQTFRLRLQAPAPGPHRTLMCSRTHMYHRRCL